MTAEKEFNKGFNLGYYCAIATLIRQHDQPTMAEDMLRCNYMPYKEMVKIGVDPFDLEVLKPICKEIERKNSLHR